MAELPRFQQTRGVLRMLALWVAHAYQQGFKGGHKDPLIGLGTAPLEDSMFRSAVFEQLGETKLEGAVTTDICGKKGSHAVRLDAEAKDTIKNARLHCKVATAILFESNGGQAKGEATQPEIRLAVAEPGLDIGNVETALEALAEASYYLTVERNRYRFSLKENLNKRFADRRATIQPEGAQERIREEIQKVFAAGAGAERVFLPEKTNQVPDRPVVTLVVLAPDMSLQDEKGTTKFIESVTRESGSSSRTFKSALIFCVPESADALSDEARKVLAWEDIDDEADDLKFDDTQLRQLEENVKKAKRDLKETIWRTYKVIMLLGKDNSLKKVDLGLVHSSAAPDLATLVLNHLRQTDDLVTGVSPSFLVKHWPPAFTEWATKSVRDAFFASPQFPRILSADAIRETVTRGVANGLLAYVGKGGAGFQPATASHSAGKMPAPPDYKPFCFNQALMTADIEFSDKMFLITKETAEAYLKSREVPKEPLDRIVVSPQSTSLLPGQAQEFTAGGFSRNGAAVALEAISWEATGGTVDKSGRFSAGTAEGSFSVTATAGSFKGSATLQITRIPPPPPPPPPRPTEHPKGITWAGEIPPQKWMKFYTAVLSKFAAGRGLKLKLSVEISPEGGISKQKIDETKAALRELGMNDDLPPI